jgi:hypothetical protein
MIDAEGMSLKKSFAELIVNAIDQDGWNIALAYNVNAGTVTIIDDGNGPPRGLEKLAEIGRHISTKKDPVGRFGVGHKDAICWLANIADVHSMTRGGDRQRMHVNWAHMLAIEDWDFVFAHTSTRTSHGLSIILTELRPRRMKTWSELPRYISELFSAAIDAGVTITVDGIAVKSTPIPSLEHKIEFDSEFDGLKFKGFAGLLKEKGAASSGWDIRYGPQSIAIGYTREGFGTSSPQGFYGRFEMLNGDRRWQLSRNKTDSEDLYDVLNCDYMQTKIIKPLLKLLKNRTETLKIRINQQLVSNSLTNMVRNAKVRIAEEEDETITTPKVNGSTIGPGGRGGGKRPPNPNPGPGPNRLVPSEEITRKKRRYDPLSPLKDRIKEVQNVEISWHQDKTKGFFFLDVRERGTHIIIYIDQGSAFGARTWEDERALHHYAVMCLSSYFGLGVDIMNQLRLPVGDAGDPNELKISKALAYLLENVEMNQFFTANGNGNGKEH